MTLQDLMFVAGTGGSVAGVVGFLLFRYFFNGYLSEKGKNLATKEDVAAITHEIEKVRTQYAILIEERKTSNQLRVAAIDKRMQAHQEAFTHWREIMRTIHSDQINTTTMECQDWWEKNCLYLEQSAREALTLAMSCAHDHASMLSNHQDVEIIKKNWSSIMTAGPAILQAVQLPGLTTVENRELMRPPWESTN